MKSISLGGFVLVLAVKSSQYHYHQIAINFYVGKKKKRKKNVDSIRIWTASNFKAHIIMAVFWQVFLLSYLKQKTYQRRVMDQSHSHYLSLIDRQSLANPISMRLDFDLCIFFPIICNAFLPLGDRGAGDIKYHSPSETKCCEVFWDSFSSVQ